MATEARDGSVPRDDLVAALAEAQRRIEQLETALTSRVVIEQAKGILRERFGWSIDEAFEVLRYTARSSRTRLHDVAEAVVESNETPVAITIAIARGTRVRAAHLHEHAEAQQERAAKLLAALRDVQARIQVERRDGRRSR